MLTQEQLNEFKKMLQDELKEIEERNREKLEEMENALDTDKFHGDEADQANYLEARNRALRLRDRDRKLIGRILKTIEKIDHGDYGVCDSCGIDIPVERLKMRPVANLCIDCKREQEEEEERDKSIKRQ